MKTLCRHVLAVLGIFLLVGPVMGLDFQETEIQKAKIYLETYPLLTETDLYCSFFIWNGPPHELRIAGAEHKEFELHADGEIVYIKAGRAQGVAAGQKMLIVQVGPTLKHPRTGTRIGPVCFRRGMLTVMYVEEDRAAARIDKACGPVRVGDALIPFEVRETVEGKNEGFVPYQESRDRLTGTVIYIQDELNQAAPPSWVLIDLGREAGIRPGQQLTIFQYPDKGLPRRSIANGVVVDVQDGTATMKILSADEFVVTGDGVEVKEPT